MWFLIKGSFYCTVTLVALSYFGAPPKEETEGRSQLVIGDAITAASGAYDYMASLCEEKPEVCEKGKETFQALGHRAREGALVAYQILDKQFSEDGGKPAMTSAADAGSESGNDISIEEIVAGANEEIRKNAVEVVLPQAQKLAGEEIVTGTVVPGERPKHLPKPYTPPKS